MYSKHLRRLFNKESFYVSFEVKGVAYYWIQFFSEGISQNI